MRIGADQAHDRGRGLIAKEAAMSKPLLQTTIVGSLPKPAWLAQPNQLWAPWLAEGECLREAKRDATRLAIRDQERAGIDILTDGEQSRRHFVTGYLEHLRGIDFEHLVIMHIRQRYDAKVPQVVGPIARPRPVHSDDVRLLRAETDRPIKFTLPGPMTIVDTLHDAYYKDRARLAMTFARILNREARELERLGVNVIQFDEPAFNVDAYGDDVRSWGIEALECAADGLKCKTAVHICYGYGIKANIEWKKTLGSQWRQYEHTFPLIARSTIDQVSLECHNSKVPLELIGLLKGKDIMVGAIDVATERIETPQEVARTIRAALKYVAPGKLYPCTNCGMVPLPRAVALGKLNALVAGARIVRAELAKTATGRRSKR
jgi:5-methyltetrahydropteroyltriglutamate--homocysteine methyltransferase